MLPNVVAVVNGKGGVGKTSVVANVAGALAEGGWRVLVADLDAQGDLGQNLTYRGKPADDRGAALAAVVGGEEGVGIPVIRDVRPGLDVIPGGPLLGEAAERLDADRYDGRLLLRCLAAVAHEYHMILIDCPPRIGPITCLAMTAARGLVVPVAPDDCSLSGLTQVARQLGDVRRHLNPDLALLGVAMCFLPVEAKRVRRDLRADLEALPGNLHVFESVIRYSVRAAFDHRRRRKTAEEYVEYAATATTKRFEALSSGERDPAPAPSGAARGLADDYRLLAGEINTRLTAVNAPREMAV